MAWSFSRLGFRRRALRFAGSDVTSMAGKTCLVTGANSGLGFAIAEGLARQDADLWLLCRSRERGVDAARRLDALGAGTVHLEVVDIADLASIDAVVARLPTSTVDVLVHNAGALLDQRTDTRQGIEATFALHVIGPERLTRGLLEPLRAAGSARVIYVASGGMYAERLSVDELLSPPVPFDGVRAYALAKRAQVVLTEMWAAREPAIQFYAMHPGWADTEGVRTSLPRFYRATRRWLRSPAEGADTAVWLAAVDPPVCVSGAFVFDRAEATRYLVPGTRATAEQHDRLWREVERLATGRSTAAGRDRQ